MQQYETVDHADMRYAPSVRALLLLIRRETGDQRGLSCLTHCSG